MNKNITHSVVSTHPFIVEYLHVPSGKTKKESYAVCLLKKEIEAEYDSVVFNEELFFLDGVHALIKSRELSEADIMGLTAITNELLSKLAEAKSKAAVHIAMEMIDVPEDYPEIWGGDKEFDQDEEYSRERE